MFMAVGILLIATYLIIRKPDRLIPSGKPPEALATVTPAQRGEKKYYEIVTMLEKDAVQAIDNPQIYSAEQADAEYLPGELVIGVTINGESRAYASGTLDNHEIVNDELGGRKIAVTWSPLCFTGIVYSRMIAGEEYDFGVSGKLIMNAQVMYDRQTDSLWGQMIGESVEGPMKGTRLEFIPALHTTWEDWRSQHPDTTALVKGRIGDYSSYGAYFGSQDAGVQGRTHFDDRLKVKEFVIGAEVNDEASAYPFRSLGAEPVVNDELGGIPIVVVFNTASASSAVFNRQLEDGTVLTFSLEEGITIKDSETGSRWNGMEGIAVDGPLEGTNLKPVKNTLAFWFAWKDWYPQTRVYLLE